MALRSGHGRGAGTPRVEVLPPSELPPAQASGPGPLATDRDAKTKRITTPEAARALAKLPRRTRFLPRRIACHPDFEPHNRRRLEWQRKRIAELNEAHGGVSHGVGAIVSQAAWLHAGAEFVAELAAASGDAALFKTSAGLSSTARQHELAAWELCAREAVARKNTPSGRAASTSAHLADLAAFGPSSPATSELAEAFGESSSDGGPA